VVHQIEKDQPHRLGEAFGQLGRTDMPLSEERFPEAASPKLLFLQHGRDGVQGQNPTGGQPLAQARRRGNMDPALNWEGIVRLQKGPRHGRSAGHAIPSEKPTP